ncbi:MAG: DNA polymerase III subunit gamma/tau [Clostridia bacterium]|nr:DNA polymerase III subunit gamma/tau [Clostridia bacterium]
MYQALYRKYRPKVFSDVVGQDHITTTLKNEIKLGRIAHAYLFTGTRGTGKTTCAKIFAKAINCLSPHDGEPCGECEICKGVENESILDVIEMDAASNSGVDNMRDIIEDVRSAPLMTRYKVYIIDEVHALSANAFNALLKTLEEPPADTVFILATTEVHKLAATILSRCQRFDFRRVDTELIAEVISKILKSQEISFDEDAAMEVARMGRGSVRDALSVLERCISADERLTREHVLSILGMANDEMLLTFLDCFHNKDLTRALLTMEQVYAGGKDISVLCERLIWMCRCVLVAKSGKAGAALIQNSESGAKEIIEFSRKVSLTEALWWSKELSSTLDRLPRTTSHRIVFEMCLIRLCEERLSNDEAALSERVARLEDMVSSQDLVMRPAGDLKPASVSPKMAKPEEYEAPQINICAADEKEDETAPFEPAKPEENKDEAMTPIKEEAAASPAPEYEEGLPFGKYARTIAEIMKDDPMTGSLMKNTAAYAYKTHIEIICANIFDKELLEKNKKTIEEAISKQLGKKMKVELAAGKKSDAPKMQKRAAAEPDPLDSIAEYDEDNNITFDDL